MKVALVQEGVVSTAAENTERAVQYIAQARDQNIDFLVFPECFLTGYGYDSRDAVLDHALSLQDEPISRLVESCRTYRMHIVVGFLEKQEHDLYNAAALIGPDGIIGVHRKAHLPYMGADRFADVPLTEPLQVFHTEIGIVGICICYEIRFPEMIRTLALQGAEIIAVPTNWIAKSRMLAESFSQVRAAENRVYLITANRHDKEGEFEFMGGSRIFAPDGSELVCAADQGGLHAAEIDTALARDKKIIFTEGSHEVDTFSDRRPDLYFI